MKDDPRRKPIHRGDIFCSPACGAGCTSAQYDAAVAAAAKMVAQLGPAWRPVIWENMAWHCRAEVYGDGITVGVAVYPEGGAFWCTISTNPHSQAIGATPLGAFRQARAIARSNLDKTTKFVELLEGL